MPGLITAITNGDYNEVVRILNENPNEGNQPFVNATLELTPGIIFLNPYPIHAAILYAQTDNNPERGKIIDLFLAHPNNITGADIHVKDAAGNNALHYAALQPNCEFISKMLIYRGLSVTEVNNLNATAAAYAMQENVSLANRFMEYQNKYNELIDAVFNNQKEKVSELIKNDKDLMIAAKVIPLQRIGIRELGVLHLAAYRGSADVIDLLISQYGYDINTPNRYGETPLHIAAATGNIAMINHLIKSGANIKQPDDHGNTVLHYAILAGANREVVKELLKHHADPNVPNEYGNTPGHYAIMRHDEAILDELIQAKANFTLKNKDDETPLHLALRLKCSNDSIDLDYLKKFINAVGDLKEKSDLINAKDKNGIRAFDYIFQPGILSEEAVTLLIDAGADPNTTSQFGRSLLHYAFIMNMSTALMQKLLDKGADINFQDKEGQTVLHYAAMLGNADFVKFLIDRGADSLIADIYGRTAYNRAATKEHHDVMKLFITAAGKDAVHLNKRQSTPDYQALFQEVINPGNKLIQEGRALMKALKYDEAHQKFQAALPYLAPDQTHLIEKVIRWSEKSKALAGFTPNPNLINQVKDMNVAKVISSNIVYGKDVHQRQEEIESELDKLYKNPMVKPFLKFMALGFLTNDRMAIHFRNNLRSLISKKLIGGYYTYSSIYLDVDNNSKIYYGGLLHEIAHYLFNKTYHNSNIPYSKDNLERKNEFDLMLKNVLKNIADYLNDSYQAGIDINQLEKMSTWDAGLLLANAFKNITNHLPNNAHIDYTVLPGIFSIFTSYSPHQLHIEFVVKFAEFLGEGLSVFDLGIIQPLIDFHVKYLFPDFEALIAKSEEIITELYPLNYIGPRYAPLLADVTSDQNVQDANIKIFSWKVEEKLKDHVNSTDRSLYAESTINKEKRYNEILTKIERAVTNDKVDLIALQEVLEKDSPLVELILQTLGPEWKMTKFGSEVTFYNGNKLTHSNSTQINSDVFFGMTSEFTLKGNDHPIQVFNIQAKQGTDGFRIENEIGYFIRNSATNTVIVGDMNYQALPKLITYSDSQIPQEAQNHAACYFSIKQHDTTEIHEAKNAYDNKPLSNNTVEAQNKIDRDKFFYTNTNNFTIVPCLDDHTYKNTITVANKYSLEQFEKLLQTIFVNEGIKVRCVQDIHHGKYIAVKPNADIPELEQFPVLGTGGYRAVRLIEENHPIFNKLANRFEAVKFLDNLVSNLSPFTKNNIFNPDINQTTIAVGLINKLNTYKPMKPEKILSIFQEISKSMNILSTLKNTSPNNNLAIFLNNTKDQLIALEVNYYRDNIFNQLNEFKKLWGPNEEQFGEAIIKGLTSMLEQDADGKYKSKDISDYYCELNNLIKDWPNYEFKGKTFEATPAFYDFLVELEKQTKVLMEANIFEPEVISNQPK